MRLIDADKLIELANNHKDKTVDANDIARFPTAHDANKVTAPKKVYHFLEDDTFETTCCGIDVTNKDYNFCPNCGCELGEVEEVEGAVKDE